MLRFYGVPILGAPVLSFPLTDERKSGWLPPSINLDSKSGLTSEKGKWHTLKVRHVGDRIEGWLDGKKLLEATDDAISKSGGVALWTKADAVTSFDDLTCTEAGK